MREYPQLDSNKVRLVLTGSLHGEWQAIAIYFALLHLMDRDGRVPCCPERLRAMLGMPKDDFNVGISRLSSPDEISRYDEDRDGHISITGDEKLSIFHISAYRHLVLPQRPTIPHWIRLRDEIFERDNFECVYCGERAQLECDHIIPVSKGGSNAKTNLATACKRCNSSKRAKHLSSWRPELISKIEQLGLEYS